MGAASTMMGAAMQGQGWAAQHAAGAPRFTPPPDPVTPTPNVNINQPWTPTGNVVTPTVDPNSPGMVNPVTGASAAINQAGTNQASSPDPWKTQATPPTPSPVYAGGIISPPVRYYAGGIVGVGRGIPR